jgi:CheY-like chemotaxis protein
VTTASSAREGLDLALRIRPDVIVSDFWMEDFDGDRLLEYLLRDSRTRSIPVILLTAKDSPETIERLFALGARKVISKPFVPSRLAEVIRDIADS